MRFGDGGKPLSRSIIGSRGDYQSYLDVQEKKAKLKAKRARLASRGSTIGSTAFLKRASRTSVGSVTSFTSNVGGGSKGN